MSRASHSGRTSTATRRSWDTSRVREALKGPGSDTRHWVSYGTVAVVGEDGQPDFSDPHAVHIGPEGVELDVILQPTNIPVTCRYMGAYGGVHGDIAFPIAPGDEVLVMIPDGDLNNCPVAFPSLTSDYAPMFLDEERKPHFKNDRILIFAENVPVDIRTKGGSRVQLLQDGSVKVDSPSGSMTLAATEANLRGVTLTKLGSDSPTLQPLLNGVLTGETIEPILGVPFSALGQGSVVVLAKKA